MASLGEVIAQLHVALQLIGNARAHLTDANSLLGESSQLFTQVWQTSPNPMAAQTLAVLSEAQQAIADRHQSLESAMNAVQGYLQGLGADSTATSPPQGNLPPPAAQAALARAGKGRPASVAGQWQGKNAAEHARDAGKLIGRAPAKPKKRPIREVRSLEELDELFAALSAGGEKIEAPTYAGSVLLFPDGTRIGYRVKSKTTVEPTIDITAPGGWSLKIHVNTQGWD